MITNCMQQYCGLGEYLLKLTQPNEKALYDKTFITLLQI